MEKAFYTYGKRQLTTDLEKQEREGEREREREKERGREGERERDALVPHSPQNFTPRTLAPHSAQNFLPEGAAEEAEEEGEGAGEMPAEGACLPGSRVAW
jgi:hypothetical protein